VSGLSHFDTEGRAVMVDVSAKPETARTATARARVVMQPETLRTILAGEASKGDVIGVARLAGIMAAKRTAELIPLCHNIEIEQISVDLELTDGGVEIRAAALCSDKTGIEMEALTAVSVAALTIYDMCKAVDKTMRIQDLRLLEKTKEEL